MSTERRRNADGGRRRAEGPGDGPRGGGRRRADGPPPDGRAGGRRRPDDEGGFFGDGPAERPRRPRPQPDAARAEGGPRRRPPEGQRRRPPEGGGRPRRRPPEDGDRPRRRPEGERPRRRPEGAAAAGGAAGAAGGRRRADGPRDPRAPEHGARSEGGGRGPGRGGRGSGGRGGGGGGRRRGREEEPDDRPWIKRAWSKTWKPLLAFCGLMIIGGVAAFAVLYSMAPDYQELEAAAEEPPSATQILWAGEGDEPGEVAVTTGEVQRIMVTRDEIPQTVINGVLAAEQAGYYEDPGINIVGIGRAVVTGGSAGGGSTITQQMARNYYSNELSTEQTISRKIKEIFIAIKLDQQVPKDEILTTYLNTIYFGRGASGIQMAAERYFGKELDELTPAEGAFLGLIIQQPSRFENVQEGSDDFWARYLTTERWPYMQGQLAEMYEATGGERGLPQDEAMALEIPERIEYNPEASSETNDPKFGYVRQEVVNEVVDNYPVTAQDLATGGYQVQTSLDSDLMDAARLAFDEALPPVSGFEQPVLMEGLTAIDNESGRILAFHGGDDVVTDPENSLTHRTQAGSSYKPYVLVTALKQGIGLETTFNGDSPQTFAGVGEVNNSNLEGRGPVNLIESTADSINTSYVHAAEVVGAENVEATAIDLGVNPGHTETSTTSPLIALGTHLVSTYDQANAYSTIANEGTSIPAHMVVEVRDGDGNPLEPNAEFEEALQGSEEISSAIAADATYAMRQVVEAGGGSRAALADGRPVAGKTGTSSNAVSTWFVGYTPQVTTAVSLSRLDGGQLAFEGIPNSATFGGTTSALVWKHFMDNAMAEMEVQDFPQRANVGETQNFAPSPSPSPSDDPCDPDQPGNGNGNGNGNPDCDDPSEDPSDDPSNDDVCDPDQPGNGNGNGNGNPDCPDPGDPGDCPVGDLTCQEPDPSGDPTDDCSGPLDWNCPDPTEDPTADPSPGDGGGGNGGGGGNNAMILPSRED